MVRYTKHMHIFFSGIGGTGIGPLALIAKQAGYEVSGSDLVDSQYVDYLRSQGVQDILIEQTEASIAAAHASKPIDWFVYTSALPKDSPEIAFVKSQNIKNSKRDELINFLLKAKDLKLIAITGTHGKTTTTTMIIWLFQQLGIPVSYSVGAKSSFADMGKYQPGSDYFVYECDEYERNFLKFYPYLSVIAGIDWDHPDAYPTREDYYQAFVDFCDQSKDVIAHPEDLEKIGLSSEPETIDLTQINLVGEVNRKNAQLAIEAVHEITQKPVAELVDLINKFPGLSRRFEKIAENIYSDYAHTPEKIRGALQMAHEVQGDNVVVVYEGLHNTRQHFIKDDLPHLFDDVKKLYIVPSYRAREDESLEDLTPEKLVQLVSQPEKAEASKLDESLKAKIQAHAEAGDLVLCLSAGGGKSLDEWLRSKF